MSMLWFLAGYFFTRLSKIGAFCESRYWLTRFKKAGVNISIARGFTCHGPDKISIGDDVVIANRVTLRALNEYPWSNPTQVFEPEIELRSGCFINNGVHISSAVRIVIGNGVMIADHCFITDNNHGYRDVSRGIKDQPLTTGSGIYIGNETWIGANSCVIGSVTIGRHCVIGANSVVTKDLPDFCVAAGNPARIIKRYDSSSDSWVNVF